VLRWLETLPEYRELMKQPAEQRAVLDVGCGVGGAVKGLTDLDWRAYGVEPDPMLARAGSERFGVTIVPEFMHRELLPEVDFSLVFSLHTFEHLLDPLDVVRSARELLTRGGSKRGYIFIAVPTWSHATHPAWEWMNTSHTYLFSSSSLGNLLARAGFRMLHSNYPKPDYHPCSEPSEVWVFGELDPEVESTDRLPYRENPLSVQAAMAAVPLRWPLAALGRRVRRALRGLSGGGRSSPRPAPSGAEKS
jgi:SAM-dependent methyltransferase